MFTATEYWPSLPLTEWRDSCETLRRWSQIVGKIRLSQMPRINHSWHVPLYVTARGLTTSAIPYDRRSFEINFDFIDHQLLINVSDGARRAFPLMCRSVADFYQELFENLNALGLQVSIHDRPSGTEDTIPFTEDYEHASYDAQYANRLWHVLMQTDRVFWQFRARFTGKCSPVHFFWGGFDLAITRFSGRPAPPHPGGVPNLPDRVTRDAHSHEISSAGFWPGGGPHPFPLFYSYAYPEPEGFSAAGVLPKGAFYSEQLREFILPYDVVREAAAPCEVLLDFLQTSYEAAADLGGWDRAALECPAWGLPQRKRQPELPFPSPPTNRPNRPDR